ncbi:MAG: hypothetical protein Tsb009_14590 [Planctomycetaceae bacterium]
MPSVVHLSESSTLFTADIVEQVRCGFGFTPFVGSGLSAPSGILMGKTFSGFLAHTMYLVLEKKWDLRSSGWPPYPTEKDVEIAREFILRKFKDCLKRFDLEVRMDTENLNEIDGIEFRGLPGQVQPPESLRPLIPDILPKTKRARDADQQLKEQFRINNQLEDLLKPTANPFASPSSSDYAVEMGIRSLFDWRAALQFFSKVKINDTGSTKRISVGEIDYAVIDGFNSYIIRGVQPTLGHKMLAHLSHRLRMRTLLTTNFDQLIETAFAQLSYPLHVLDVRTGGHLPDPATVRAQNCLIKLHGQFFETRADFTLDELPDEEDLKRFVKILRGAKDREIVLSHLMVIGFSGSDLRILQFLKHALNKIRDLKLYWICYDEWDYKRLEDIFYEREYEGRITAFQTRRPDLLLYELYQENSLCLPGGGFSYEFTHKVPPAPPVHDDPAEKAHRETAEQIFAWIDKSQPGDELSDPRTKDRDKKNWIIRQIEVEDQRQGGASNRKNDSLRTGELGRLFVSDFQTGAADTMRQVFDLHLQSGKFCIWLELQDFPTVSYLADEIFRTIALRLGRHQSQHLIYSRAATGTNPFEKPELDERYWNLLLKHLGVSGNDWCLYVYGRNVPGTCSGWEDKAWTIKEYRQLKEFHKRLVRCGFTVIYLPYTISRQQREVEEANWLKNEYRPSFERADLEAFGFLFDESSNENSTREEFLKKIEERVIFPAKEINVDEINLEPNQQLIKKKGRDTTYENIIAEVMGLFVSTRTLRMNKETDKDDWRQQQQYRRLQFLYASTLFRQSRHVSAFFSIATYGCPFEFNTDANDNDVERAGIVAKWIAELQREHVFFYKPGGYCWKHRDVRIGLQKLIENLPPLKYRDKDNNLDENKHFDFSGQLRARSHYWIADWYMRAFMATGHGATLLEVIYHYLLCAEFAPYAKRRSLKFDDERNKSHQRWLFTVAVNEICKALQLGTRWLRMWMQADLKSNLYFGKEVRDGILERLKKIKEKLWEGSPPLFFKQRILLLERLMEHVAQSLQKKGGLEPPLRIPHVHDHDPEPSIRSQSTVPPRKEKDKWDNRFVNDNWHDWSELRIYPILDRYELEYDPVEVTDSEYRRGVRTGELLTYEDYNNYEALSENEKEIRELFGQHFTADGAQIQRKDLIEISSMLARSAHEHPEFDAVGVVEQLIEYAYTYFKRAKLEKLSNFLSGKSQQRRRLVQVTAICYLGLEVAHLISPDELERELFLRIKLQTFYGAALGHLDRYFEAHRRLNEATALLSKTRVGFSDEELAIIRLRRAEVYLCEAKSIADVFEDGKQQPDRHPLAEKTGELVKHPKCRKDWQRLFYATMDDAVASLESAHQLLSGSSHSPLWWGRYLVLVMYCISLVPKRNSKDDEGTDDDLPNYRMLLFRKRQLKEQMLINTFRHALLVGGDDPYMRLLFVQTFCRAAQKLSDLKMSETQGKEGRFLFQEYKKLVFDVLEEIRDGLSISNSDEDGINELSVHFYEVVKLVAKLTFPVVEYSLSMGRQSAIATWKQTTNRPQTVYFTAWW